MYIKDYSIQLAKDIVIRFPKKVGLFFKFLNEWRYFKNETTQRFPVKFRDIYPCFNDRVSVTPFDHHYTYHPAWAARILAKTHLKSVEKNIP